MTNSAPLLACTYLSKSFGANNAIRDVSLNLQPRELMAVLGPSGCGKSTLLRLIAGLERPDDGRIIFQNQPWSDDRYFVKTEQRACGLVFQDLALFPHLDVEKNIGFALSRQRSKATVARLLELVKLHGSGKKMMHTLSGGEQQRVALARSLAPKPVLLLLDEPFSSLDLRLRQHMRYEVRSILKKQGVSAILVTHDQQEAFGFADTIAVMHNGAITQIGSPDAIYHTPQNRQTAHFVGEANFIDFQLAMTLFPNLEKIIDAAHRKKACTVMIRPEDFSLEAPTRTPGIGTIIDVLFQGEFTELHVQAEEAPALKVRTHSHTPWTVGQNVALQPHYGCLYDGKDNLITCVGDSAICRRSLP